MGGSLVSDLRSVPLFQAVPDDALDALARRAKVRVLEKGKLVFKEGSPADSLYVVLCGSVKIYLNEPSGAEVVLDTKNAGQYFGEMMLDYRPRSASVMTLEPSQFAVISREDFSAFLRSHPQAAEQLILNLIRITRGMNDRARDGAILSKRLRHYVSWLESVKAPELPTVKRWLIAKRWVLAGLLTILVAHFYFMDIYVDLMSMPGLTIFTGR